MIKYLIFSVILCIFASFCTCEDVEVTQQCLTCICETISSCNTTSGCSGNVCGAFRISWGYWADAGKPTVGDESPEEAKSWSNCALDSNCASQAVQGYMHKFQQDCNGDGKVNCDDFTLAHVIGGYGCAGATLPEPYGQRYKQCKELLKL